MMLIFKHLRQVQKVGANDRERRKVFRGEEEISS